MRQTSLPNRRSCVYFKNKQPGKWDLKWRPGYRIVCIERDGHFIHIENQATGKIQSCNVTDIILEPPIEFWNVDTQFGRAGCYINHPTNLPTIQLTSIHNHYKKTCTTALLLISMTSTLQHDTYAHTYHKLIKNGTRRISHFPTSPTGISHMTLLDHNSTCLPRKPGVPLENLQ